MSKDTRPDNNPSQTTNASAQSPDQYWRSVQPGDPNFERVMQESAEGGREIWEEYGEIVMQSLALALLGDDEEESDEEKGEEE